MRPRHPVSPLEIFISFWNNRQLIWQMTQREVIGRYRGSVLGLAWSFFSPLLMLSVYTFVFSVVFKARWGVGGDESRIGFAIVLFVGMIVHALFSECINRAPGLILSNVNYVKKVVFPLEILPWVALGSTLFHATISLVVLFGVMLLLQVPLPWTVIFLPMVLLPLLLATMGFAWFLAATGVFVRDVAQTTGILTTVLLFLTPVFYPVSALPAEYRVWLQINPLTFVVEEARNVVLWGRTPSVTGWLVHLTVSFMLAWGGFWWFQKTRKGFADVL
jgi:lipopolysaccharide transport system permease protein